MSEMLMRVAEAIYNSDFDGSPSQAFKDRDLDVIGTYLDGARAAIEAMREPTRTMIDAAAAVDRYADPGEEWGPMIDAALSSGEPKADVA